MKRKNNLQDQVMEHIHSRLTSRFGAAGADRIMPKLSTRLYEMTTSHDATVETGMTVGVETERVGTTENMVFLTQLNSIVYPFIALMQVLEELPIDAASETLRIWNTLPWTVVDKARRSI